MVKRLTIGLLLMFFISGIAYSQTINIGMNYPKTGPYHNSIGLPHLQAAEMTVEEINASGGIAGKKINLIIRDTQSKADIAKANVEEMIDKHDCKMILGGDSSGAVIAGGQAARAKDRIFFGTMTYSNDTTGVDGHKYMFRECYNSWMAARVLSHYLRENYLMGKRYFYITTDNTWGWTTESSIRKFSNTSNNRIHKGTLIPFPTATMNDFKNAAEEAEKSGANLMVVILFGTDMTNMLQLLHDSGIKKKMDAIVVPNLDLPMAVELGPEIMEGVLGTLPWAWNIPYQYDYPKGIRFVEKYAAKYKTYPSSAAASVYTALYQYKDAVERAGTFDSKPVISSLENHRFTLLKDEQIWRDFDHQCVQTVYAVRCKPADVVRKDKFNQDFFEVVNTMSGMEAAIDKFNWERSRERAGQPTELQF